MMKIDDDDTDDVAKHSSLFRTNRDGWKNHHITRLLKFDSSPARFVLRCLNPGHYAFLAELVGAAQLRAHLAFLVLAVNA